MPHLASFSSKAALDTDASPQKADSAEPKDFTDPQLAPPSNSRPASQPCRPSRPVPLCFLHQLALATDPTPQASLRAPSPSGARRRDGLPPPSAHARGDDGRQGGNAVVAQSVASARCAGRISARDGFIQSAPHVDRSGHIALQQRGAALHRQDIFGRRPRILQSGPETQGYARNLDHAVDTERHFPRHVEDSGRRGQVRRGLPTCSDGDGICHISRHGGANRNRRGHLHTSAKARMASGRTLFPHTMRGRVLLSRRGRRIQRNEGRQRRSHNPAAGDPQEDHHDHHTRRYDPHKRTRHSMGHGPILGVRPCGERSGGAQIYVAHAPAAYACAAARSSPHSRNVRYGDAPR